MVAVVLLASPTQVAPADPAVTEGRALYGRYCALCHGDNAEGHAADHAPALGNDEFLRIASDGYLTRSILTGRAGTPMSAFSDRFGGPLSHTDVGKIVAFLRSLQVSPTIRLVDRPTTGNVAKGLGLFTEHCATCHSRDREQATAPHLEHPAFQELATNGYLEHSIRFGRPGTPMEPWGDRLADDEIDDLIAAVRSFHSPLRRGPRAPPQGAQHQGHQDPHGNHAHGDHAHAPGNHPGDSDDRPNPVLDVWSQISADELVLGQDHQAPAFSLRGRWYVSAEELGRALAAQQKMILLDARAMSDWLAGHLPGALPVPFYADSDTFERIPDDDTWVVIYCGCPHAAADRVATRLRDRGIDHIAVLDEGYFHWRDNDYPVVTGPARGELGSPRRELRVDLPAP